MVLRNYWEYRKVADDPNTWNVSSGGTIRVPIKDTAGNDCDFYYYNIYNSSTTTPGAANNNAFWKQLGIMVGSGATEPTVNDYNLESQISNAQIVVNSLVFSAPETNKEAYTLTATITASADITIREVGLFKPIHYSNSGDYSKDVLMARNVLSTPISIASGASQTIAFEFAISW